MDLSARLSGTVIPAVPALLDERGRLDTGAQGGYARWMAGQRVGAVALWAHTGRGLRLSDEQRTEVLAAWRRDAPGLPLVCGVGVPHAEPLPADPAARTDRVIACTLAMVEAARAGGAAAVMVHPPAALAALPDPLARVLELHRVVAATGLPTIAFFLYEAAGGVSYPPDLVRQILALDGVLGIKIATLDSILTFQDLAAVVSGLPGSLLITGEDRFLGYSLMLGARSALIGLAAALTDASVSLLDAWTAGRQAEFVRRSAMIDQFARATFCVPMEGYVQRVLWALEADGVIDGPWRDPFGPALPAAERERVRAAVRALRAT